jgi:hypothetical protein
LDKWIKNERIEEERAHQGEQGSEEMPPASSSSRNIGGKRRKSLKNDDSG